MDGDPDLLASDGAFVDLSDWRKTDVSGPDALSWLDRYVTAAVADLAPGRARQALLLSAQGGLRAEFTVAVAGSSVLLLQDPGQNPPVHELLGPYIGLCRPSAESRRPGQFPGRAIADVRSPAET
jgi:folate-binding Fe-S cluster repair protein YgfZ